MMCDNSSKVPSTPGEQELGSSSSNMTAEPSEATAATSTSLLRSGQHFRTEAAVKSNSETETLQKLNSKHNEFALFPASSQSCSQIPARSPRTQQRDSLVRIRKPCWSSALRSRRSRTSRRSRGFTLQIHFRINLPGPQRAAGTSTSRSGPPPTLSSSSRWQTVPGKP